MMCFFSKPTSAIADMGAGYKAVLPLVLLVAVMLVVRVSGLENDTDGANFSHTTDGLQFDTSFSVTEESTTSEAPPAIAPTEASTTTTMDDIAEKSTEDSTAPNNALIIRATDDTLAELRTTEYSAMPTSAPTATHSTSPTETPISISIQHSAMDDSTTLPDDIAGKSTEDSTAPNNAPIATNSTSPTEAPMAIHSATDEIAEQRTTEYSTVPTDAPTVTHNTSPTEAPMAIHSATDDTTMLSKIITVMEDTTVPSEAPTATTISASAEVPTSMDSATAGPPETPGDETASTASGESSSIVEVKVEERREQNEVYQNASGKVFMNIPYAQSPTSFKRFKSAQPTYQDTKRPGEHLREHGQRYHAAYCPQPNSSRIQRWMSTPAGAKMEMSEDCLHLHVLVPSIPKGANVMRLYPVYVHLHGGFLYSGSAADYGLLGPLDNFVNRYEVVLVLLQYRLGPFGFLNLKADEMLAIDESESSQYRLPSHNIGIGDILMGLRWVNEHIVEYNGDPYHVTLGGDGAGACAAAYLGFTRHSSDAEQLFSQLLLLSGTVEACVDVASGSKSAERLTTSEKFIAEVCDATKGRNYTRGVMGCLHNLSTEEMVQVEQDLGLGMWELGGVEDDGAEGAATGNFTVERSNPPLKVLMGVARNAWRPYDHELRKQVPLLQKYEHNTEHYLIDMVHLLFHNENDADAFVNKTLELYLREDAKRSAGGSPRGGAALIEHRPESEDEWRNFYLRMMTDAMLTSAIVRDADYFRRAGHDVLLYEFAIDIGDTFPHVGGEHDIDFTSELAYLFMPEWLWEGLDKSQLEEERHRARCFARVMARFFWLGSPLSRRKDATPTEGPLYAAAAEDKEGENNTDIKSSFDRSPYLVVDEYGYFTRPGPLLSPALLQYWEEFKKKVGILPY